MLGWSNISIERECICSHRRLDSSGGRMSRERVAVFDTTLRDGEQSPGCSMNLEEKVRMARQLDALGTDIIEAGFPIASDDDYAAVREVSRVCRRPIIAALCRTTPEDVERAWSALSDAAHPRIHDSISIQVCTSTLQRRLASA